MASKWDEIKSRKIRDVLRKVLTEDDKILSHGDTVELVRATLEDGYITFDELSDLNAVARISETMTPRSKMMLVYLAHQVIAASAKGAFAFATSRQKYAAEILCDFMKRPGRGAFPNLDRDMVGIDILLRVANPNIINQRSTDLCGPVSFLYGLAFDSPAVYAKFAIDLFEKGIAKIGRTEIDPSADCRKYTPPPPMSHGEWLTAGSLRDSENFLLDFDDVGRDFSAGTTNGEVARWFERAGYTDVHHADNIVMNRGAGDISLVNHYYNAGYRVVLRINSRLLKKKEQGDSSYRGNHFVVLRSPITNSGNSIRFAVYTWGYGQYQVPQGEPLTQGGFLEHWFGYVAAKPF